MFKNLFTCIQTLFQSYDKLKVIHGLCLSNILVIKFRCVCATTVQTEAKESKHSVNYQHCLLLGVVSLDKSPFFYKECKVLALDWQVIPRHLFVQPVMKIRIKAFITRFH